MAHTIAVIVTAVEVRADDIKIKVLLMGQIQLIIDVKRRNIKARGGIIENMVFPAILI